MRLPDHRPSLEIDVNLTRWKLRFNVLQHVLGFRYPRQMRANEGWSEVFAIEPGIERRVEAVLVSLGVLDVDSDEPADLRALKRVAQDGSITQLIDPQLVPAYRAALERFAREWTDDWHRGGEYRLVDARGGMCFGTATESGRIDVRTGFRYAYLASWSGDMSIEKRANCAYSQCHGTYYLEHHPRSAR